MRSSALTRNHWRISTVQWKALSLLFAALCSTTVNPGDARDLGSLQEECVQWEDEHPCFRPSYWWADHSSRNGDCLSVFANELFPSLRRVNANAQLTRQHRLTVTIAKYRLRVVVFYGWLQQKHSPSVLNDATRWGLATPRLKQERWKIIIFILSVDSVVHFMTE